jgi:hypothetical protein
MSIMTTPHALLRDRSALRGVIAMPDVVAASGLAVYVAVLFALTWRTWGDLDTDTGYDMVAASRIADGDVPYRDFIYYYGPVAPTLGAFVQLIGFSPLSAAIALGVIVTAAILTATYVLARSLTGVLGASLATAITAAVALTPNNFNFVLPHTGAATIGLLCVLVLLIALGRATDVPRAGVLLAAGTAVGLAALTKPEPAAAAVLAAVAWVIVHRRRGASPRAIGLLAAPALIIPGLVYGVLAAMAGVHNLLLENLYPRDVLQAGGDVLLRVRMPLTIGSAIELGGRVVLYAVGCAVIMLTAAVLGGAGRARVAATAATLVVAFGGVAVSLARPEVLRHGLQFVYAWIPAGALIALVLLVVRRRRAGSSVAVDREIVALTALCVLAFFTYGAFYLHAPHPQMAVYAVPLAAIFLARLHLRELAVGRAGMLVGAAWLAFLAVAGAGLALKDARIETASVRGAGGSLAEAPSEAALYAGALSWIERETTANDQILVAPMLTGLYTLSQRSSPLPEIALIPGALPSAQDEERAITRLDAAQVPLVIVDDREWPGYGHTSFGQSFDRKLADWIRQSYTRAAVIRAPAHADFEGNHPERTLSVWLRRDK